MGSIFSEKKADTTKTTCIEITSESYKCIDISAYVPTCIMITNYTPAPFIISTPTLSGLEDETLPFVEQYVTITNYDAQLSYIISTSLNGGDINITGADSFIWKMPAYQDPTMYDNIHTLSVVAHKDGDYSLGAHHSTKVAQPSAFYFAIRSDKDYLKADGLYTYWDISTYMPAIDTVTISLYTTYSDATNHPAHWDKIEALDSGGNVVASGYQQITLPPENIAVVRVAHSLTLLYDTAPDGDWSIEAFWTESGIWKYTTDYLLQEKLIEPFALTPSVSSISSGEVQVYELTNYLENLDYALYDNSGAISVSLVNGIITITASTDPIYASQTVTMTLIMTDPLTTSSRTYYKTINYIKTV